MLSILETYQQYLGQLKQISKLEWKARCPFHDDNTPSLNINSETGQFYCFGCGKGGNLSTFLDDTGHSDAKKWIERESFRQTLTTKINFLEPISLKIIEQMHVNLMNDLNKLEYLIRERYISYFCIKKFLIGFDTDTKRYSIPIKNINGKFVNIKLHNSKMEPKSLSWRKGYGTARLFPSGAIIKRNIVICEGEFDCLLLQSIGINAITNTAGARTWYIEWNKYFKDKNVTIIYDSDIAGIEGAGNVARCIGSVAENVSIIRFPKEIINNRKKLDVTDYVKLGGDIKKLIGWEQI
jgi:DNA primase